ncbi:MAG: DUF5717 family protein [Lachnospirales bacterium]
MFRELNFKFDKTTIDIVSDYIYLECEEQGTIGLINHFEDIIKVSILTSGKILIAKEVELLPNTTTNVPFTVVEKNKSFKEKIFIHNKSDVYGIEISYLKKENEFFLNNKIIFNINQVYEEYLKNKKLVTENFFDYDFKEWLYKYNMDFFNFYNLFLEDTKEDRLIENFFVATKVKEKTKIYFSEKELIFYEKDGVMVIDIPLEITNGYIEEEIHLIGNTAFVSLDKNVVFSNDFNDNKYFLKAIIDFNKIKSIRDFIYVKIGDEKIKLVFVKKQDFIISFENRILYDGDSFQLYIKNNTNKDIDLSLKSTVSYLTVPDIITVKRGKEILYDLKISLNALQRTFFKLNRKPYILCELIYEYNIGYKKISKSYNYKILLQKVGK